MNTPKHSPLPWRWHDELILSGGKDRYGKCIVESPGCFHFECDPESEANAQLIVTAVNSHAHLVESNRRLVEALEAICRIDYVHEHSMLSKQAADALTFAKGTP